MVFGEQKSYILSTFSSQGAVKNKNKCPEFTKVISAHLLDAVSKLACKLNPGYRTYTCTQRKCTNNCKISLMSQPIEMYSVHYDIACMDSCVCVNLSSWFTSHKEFRCTTCSCSRIIYGAIVEYSPH